MAKHSINTSTPSYRIFQAHFLDWQGAYPHFLAPLTRGQAINLAMTLNRINMQVAKERAAELGENPSDYLKYSAKAKDTASLFGDLQQAAIDAGGLSVGDNCWVLEISANVRHSGTRSSPAWLLGLVQKEEEAMSIGLHKALAAEGIRELSEVTGALETDDAFLARLSKHSGGK